MTTITPSTPTDQIPHCPLCGLRYDEHERGVFFQDSGYKKINGEIVATTQFMVVQCWNDGCPAYGVTAAGTRNAVTAALDSFGLTPQFDFETGAKLAQLVKVA